MPACWPDPEHAGQRMLPALLSMPPNSMDHGVVKSEQFAFFSPADGRARGLNPLRYSGPRLFGTGRPDRRAVRRIETEGGHRRHQGALVFMAPLSMDPPVRIKHSAQREFWGWSARGKDAG
jgi:hypothetical protein